MNKDNYLDLSKEQLKAKDSIWEWLTKSEDLDYLLEGKAGTGKTFLLKNIVSDYLAAEGRVLVLAPTHKALGNIKKEFKSLNCRTLHSGLGLQLTTFLPSFDPSNPSFFVNKDAQLISSYSLVIIDECSMINDKLYNYIVELAELDRTKILYVGDQSQVKPVKQESYSKVFSISNKSSLENIQRTKIDEIKEVSNHIRSRNFDTEKYVHLFARKKDFVLKKDLSDYTVIAYTNNQVARWNQIIKDNINPSVGGEKISVGDRVMFYSGLTDYEPGLGTFEVFTNGEIKTVSEIQEREGVLGNKLIFYFENCVHGLTVVRDHDLFIEEYDALVSRAKAETDNHKRKEAWKQYFIWKKSNFLTKDVVSKAHGKIKKDIDLGYAITAHKSQGSTFDKVAVDFDNIKSARNQFWELLYVASTRAKYNLLFL